MDVIKLGATLDLMLAKYNESLVGAQPSIDGWFLMGSPLPITTICIIYMYYVLYFGPRHMKDRKPYDIQSLILVYNFMQVAYNLYMVYLYYREKNFPVYFFSFGCANVSPLEARIFYMNAYSGFWTYFLNKIVDLLDTVFFVLRKKQSHVTFLHVYHHVVTLALTWILLKYYPGQEPAIVGILNTIIHTIMYTYYSIAAMGPEYKKYLWWKKYITWGQIIQFILVITYCGLALIFSCNYNLNVIKAIILHAGVNLVLFLNFYYNAYIKPSKIEALQQKQK